MLSPDFPAEQSQSVAALSYAEHLRALTDDDLRVVLHRRPEAAALAARDRPVTWTMLAAALGGWRETVRAVQSLNHFLRQVVELACLVNGTLSPARALAEGLTDEPLAIAVWELQRWGLGFGGPGGRLEVPREVRAVVQNPGGLQSPVERLAENLNVEELREIASAQGVPLAGQPRRKAELIALLARLLSRPAELGAMLQSAPEAARVALATLRQAGGATAEMAAAPSVWGDRYGWSGWAADRSGRESPTRWLLRHGFLMPVERHRFNLEIPAEVEVALRGRLFPIWDPEPPQITLHPLREHGHPLDVVHAVGGLLERWREGVPALAAGGVPRRELRHTAEALQVEEERAQTIIALAAAAGLVEERELVPERRSRSYRNPRVLQTRRATIQVTGLAERWLEMGEPERWLDLCWAGISAQEEISTAGGLGSWDELLKLLAELPEATAAPAEELGRRLAWRLPALFGEAKSAQHFVEGSAAWLRELGAAGAPPLVGLTAAGRLLRDGHVDADQLAAVFPPSVADCTVTADHRVIVTGLPDPKLAALLTKVAELLSAHPARVYRLTEASLRRGLDAGVTASEIHETLASFARQGVPQNVSALVQDVASRHGRLRVGAAGVYVSADDPALVAGLVRSRTGRDLRARLVAPTVAVLDVPSAQDAINAMRKAGLMPVLEVGRETAVSGKRTSPDAPPVGPRRPPGAEYLLTSEAVDSVVAALRSEESLPPVSQADLGRLLENASLGRGVVEMLVEGVGGQSRLLKLQIYARVGSGVRGLEVPSRVPHEVRVADIRWLRFAPTVPHQRQTGLWDERGLRGGAG